MRRYWWLPNSSVTPEAFWANVSPEPNTGCWIWMGTTDATPRGSVRLSGKKRWSNAPRTAYELSAGRRLGKLQACHRCDHPWCVNPDHIFAGTRRHNALDAVAKGIQPSGPIAVARAKAFMSNLFRRPAA